MHFDLQRLPPNFPSRGVCLGGARLGNRTLKRAETRICRMSQKRAGSGKTRLCVFHISRPDAPVVKRKMPRGPALAALSNPRQDGGCAHAAWATLSITIAARAAP